MTFLASCGLEDAKSCNGKATVPNEEGRKPHTVLLNLVVDGSEEDVNIPSSVYSVTIKGNKNIRGVPDGIKVFNEVPLSEISEIAGAQGIKLVRLPEGYSNMLELYNLQKKYPDVRFIGGKLLNIEGVNIGREDETPVVCDGIYDSYMEVKFSELDNIKVKEKKSKVKDPSKKKDKAGSSKGKTTKCKESFNKLFGGSEVEF